MLAPWDETDLYNPEHRKEKLEILLCQKAQQGDDVSSLIEALGYFKNTQNEQQWQKIVRRQTQEQLTFDSLQRILITAFAVLGVICFFDKVLNPTESITNRNNPTQSIEKQH
ncbi:MAG: hypothetical protein KME59_19475 [Trichormus sp. ATA11-4-KO1]|jgi:hypothetical protein|nr:hypothetical protein [Trichormus sp. ATA11-4-KO1]